MVPFDRSSRGRFGWACLLWAGVCLCGDLTAGDAADTVVLGGGKISSASISGVYPPPQDPCNSDPAIGTECTGGALYAGTGYGSGLTPTDRYMATPGGCTNVAEPVCNGSTDSFTLQWRTNTASTGVQSLTDGAANTVSLAALGDVPMATFCSELVYGGHDDWFWPAKTQLDLVLYANQAALGGFDLVTTVYYWSSSEDSGAPTQAWRENFTSGNQFSRTKTSTYHVRCLRTF